MKKFVLLFALLALSSCKGHFFQSWQSTKDACENFCYSEGQGWSTVLQNSAGTCICNNKEGQRVADGYHMYLNNQCMGDDEDRD